MFGKSGDLLKERPDYAHLLLEKGHVDVHVQYHYDDEMEETLAPESSTSMGMAMEALLLRLTICAEGIQLSWVVY